MEPPPLWACLGTFKALKVHRDSAAQCTAAQAAGHGAQDLLQTRSAAKTTKQQGWSPIQKQKGWQSMKKQGTASFGLRSRSAMHQECMQWRAVWP